MKKNRVNVFDVLFSKVSSEQEYLSKNIPVLLLVGLCFLAINSPISMMGADSMKKIQTHRQLVQRQGDVLNPRTIAGQQPGSSP